jgi:hypothetical protein
LPSGIIQERGEDLFQEKQRKQGMIGGEKLERIMAGLTLEEPTGGQHIVPEADRIIVLWIKGKPRSLRVLALSLDPLAYQGGFARARRGKKKGQLALATFLQAYKQALARYK